MLQTDALLVFVKGLNTKPKSLPLLHKSLVCPPGRASSSHANTFAYMPNGDSGKRYYFSVSISIRSGEIGNKTTVEYA